MNASCSPAAWPARRDGSPGSRRSGGSPAAPRVRTARSRVASDLTERLLGIVGGTINGVVYGIVGTGLAQAVAALIGFLIAGVPGAGMLASLVFILSIIPAGPGPIWG